MGSHRESGCDDLTTKHHQHVITSQPTMASVIHPLDTGRYSSDTMDTDQSCCICKIGCISYGFTIPEQVKTRAESDFSDSAFYELSSARQSVNSEMAFKSIVNRVDRETEFPKSFNTSKRVSFAGDSKCDVCTRRISDSAFYELSSARQSVNSEMAFKSIVNRVDPETEIPKSFKTSKRVSFAGDSKCDVCTRRISEPNNIYEEEEDKLDHILKCIANSKQRFPYSPQKLAGNQILFENFAAVYLTKDSDAIKLTIPGTDISLYIPPLALLFADVPQLVYIYRRLRNETPELNTDGKEAWLTPIIECGPPGLNFSKPVFLSMPYQFKVDIAQLQVSGYHSKHSFGTNWKGQRDGDDAVIIPQENEVTIVLDHFCKHGCTVQDTSGEETKWMKATIRIEHETDETCMLHLQVCDITDKEHLPANGGYQDMDASSDMLINSRGGSMTITVNGVNKNWELIEQSFKQIQFDEVWSYQSPPKVTFKARLREDNDSECLESPQFSANVDVYQEDNAQPSAKLRATSRRNMEPIEKMSSEELHQSIDDQFLKSKFRSSPHFKQAERYYNVCVALDNAVADRGWKQLAHHMGFERNETLQWIDRFSKRNHRDHSPSAILLDFYFKDATEENVLEKMRYLSNLLGKTNNEAAKHYVDEEITYLMRINYVKTSLDTKLHRKSEGTCSLVCFNAEARGASNVEQPHTRHKIARATTSVFRKPKISWKKFVTKTRKKTSHEDRQTSNDTCTKASTGLTNPSFLIDEENSDNDKDTSDDLQTNCEVANDSQNENLLGGREVNKRKSGDSGVGGSINSRSNSSVSDQ